MGRYVVKGAANSQVLMHCGVLGPIINSLSNLKQLSMEQRDHISDCSIDTAH